MKAVCRNDHDPGVIVKVAPACPRLKNLSLSYANCSNESILSSNTSIDYFYEDISLFIYDLSESVRLSCSQWDYRDVDDDVFLLESVTSKHIDNICSWVLSPIIGRSFKFKPQTGKRSYSTYGLCGSESAEDRVSPWSLQQGELYYAGPIMLRVRCDLFGSTLRSTFRKSSLKIYGWNQYILIMFQKM